MEIDQYNALIRSIAHSFDGQCLQMRLEREYFFFIRSYSISIKYFHLPVFQARRTCEKKKKEKKHKLQLITGF